MTGQPEFRRARSLFGKRSAAEGRKAWPRPTGLPTAIALAGLFISAAQVLVVVIEKHYDRRLRFEEDVMSATELLMEHRTTVDSLPRAEKLLAEVLSSGGVSDELKASLAAFNPGHTTEVVGSRATGQLQVPPVASSVDSASGPASPGPTSRILTIHSGEHQTIPLGKYALFGVRVLTKSGEPVRGAKVAWVMPSFGNLAYVSLSDGDGVSTATNLYTAGRRGDYQQRAMLVADSTPPGFTTAPEVARMAVGSGQVVFDFHQQ